MTAENRSDACSQILHVLRCVGSVGVERLAAAADVSGPVVEGCLNQLAVDGLVTVPTGPFGGWSMTQAGHLADDLWLSRELSAVGAGERVLACYNRFLDLNQRLLETCSDWQVRSIGSAPTLNDHTDAEYDAKVLTRLIRIDQSAQELCGELSNTLERFGVVQHRLSSALEQAMAGNHSYVAEGLDSYHSIWFQLHEDLLTTLGISRDEERRRSSTP